MSSFSTTHSHHSTTSHVACTTTTTPAPPPTPSNLPITTTPDVLSRLLTKLPPTLSNPPLSLHHPPQTPPLISLSPNPNPNPNLSNLSFFQLTNHQIPPHLPKSALTESQSIFNLPPAQKPSKDWPLGFDDGDGEGDSESFCFDADFPAEFQLSSLKEYACSLERVGLEVVELLARDAGFENPFRKTVRPRCLMWVSCRTGNKTAGVSGKRYPYVVALQYQIGLREYSLLSESGWVSVAPTVDSVLVTVGDIAQVWSNGKLKKVRGRPLERLGDGDSSCISMSLLVTLPMESVVSPIPRGVIDGDDDDNGGGNANYKFAAFSFEEYAWRVYRERLFFKDPLDRFRL